MIKIIIAIATSISNHSLKEIILAVYKFYTICMDI